MTNIKSSKYKTYITSVGKKMISKSMYIRGRQFLMAALLLKEKIGKD